MDCGGVVWVQSLGRIRYCDSGRRPLLLLLLLRGILRLVVDVRQLVLRLMWILILLMERLSHRWRGILLLLIMLRRHAVFLLLSP